MEAVTDPTSLGPNIDNRLEVGELVSAIKALHSSRGIDLLSGTGPLRGLPDGRVVREFCGGGFGSLTLRSTCFDYPTLNTRILSMILHGVLRSLTERLSVAGPQFLALFGAQAADKTSGEYAPVAAIDRQRWHSQLASLAVRFWGVWHAAVPAWQQHETTLRQLVEVAFLPLASVFKTAVRLRPSAIASAAR